MPWLYSASRFIIRLFTFLFIRLRIEGAGNVPKEGALLVVVNHVSMVDPPLVGYSIGRRAAFIAKEGLFRSRILSWFLHNMDVFPVRRGQLNRRTLHKVGRLLDEGRALVMFPEGTRSQTGQLQPALPGSAMLAARAGAPIVPVGIIGAEQIRDTIWLLKRPRITVRIGKPFRLPSTNGSLTKEELASLTDTIMCQVAELLPVQYRGGYSGKETKR